MDATTTTKTDAAAAAAGPSGLIVQTQADYERLRAAYLALLQRDPQHDVALAMLGADLDRVHRRLQALMGLPPRPYAPGPSVLLRREWSGLSRLAGEPG